MMQRLNDIPVYSSRKTEVTASYFNHVRLTLLRLGTTLRFSLKGFQYIDVIIDNDSWVCVDTSLNDLPMVAWLDFETKGRDNLHQPIACTQNFYHYMSGLIGRDALQLIDAHLQFQLDEWLIYDKTTTDSCHGNPVRGHLTVV